MKKRAFSWSMKGLVLSVVLFVEALANSASAEAASLKWIQVMETDQTIALNQEVLLENVKADSDEILLNEGTEFVLTDVFALDGLQVVLLKLRRMGCVDADEPSSQLTLILPNGSSPDMNAEVGVELQRACSLEVFVEAKDLYRAGLFRAL